MEKIIIVSRNAGIVSKEELLPLARSLRDSFSIQIEFDTPEHLYILQVTFHDVIDIWVKFTDSKLFEITATVLIEGIIKSFIKWSKKKLLSEKQKRPKSLSIYFNSKNRIKSITINIEGEVEDHSKEEQIFIPTPPKDSEPFFDLKKDNGKNEQEE